MSGEEKAPKAITSNDVEIVEPDLVEPGDPITTGDVEALEPDVEVEPAPAKPAKGAAKK